MQRQVPTSCLRIAALLGLLAPAASAAPAPPIHQLASTVQRVEQAPFLVVNRAASGATALERFRSGRPGGTLPSGEPLVAILRAEPVELGDAVTVTRAERHGNQIDIEVEERVCMCGHTIGGTVVPYVEIALGALPKGSYVLKLREVALTYDDEAHPERAAHPRRLFEAQGVPLEVR